MMSLDPETWEVTDPERTPPADYDWGGLSGGPLFAVVQSAIVSWRLCGIVTQFLPVPGAQVIRAAPITPVRPDGSIDKRAA